ncbi:hypothetical protein [Haladaptatus sp. W1]|uniref:hypothetical protein n=1 Tax=Haladaptatus sp. W1 TaxID=1897478 RepID=UPI000B070AB7|nr:hypothetical protein [Haladaptatus sp. W1]
MTIDVKEADDSTLDRWNSFVDESKETTPFHRREALTHLAETANAEVRFLVGYKGQEPVGIFPIFETTKGPFRMVYSPPPHLEVYYLGPALLNLRHGDERGILLEHLRVELRSLHVEQFDIDGFVCARIERVGDADDALQRLPIEEAVVVEWR